MAGMAGEDRSLRDTSSKRRIAPPASPSIPSTAIRGGWLSGQRGQAFVEYGLVMALVVVVGAVAVVQLGGAIVSLVGDMIGALIASLP